jgi:hypothetical protein
MLNRVLGFALCAVVIGACQQSNGGSGSPTSPSPSPTLSAGIAASPTSVGAAPTASMAGERPWKANFMWAVTGIQWAGVPGKDTSTFGGRCSVASDYVINGSMEGEATHAGRVTGTGSHCSQIAWGPQGPMGATYSDGQGVLNTANGSTITLRWGSGTTGVDPATGENWFRDTWTFAGGTGLFAGATGSGEEGGRFMDFNALLAGTPARMWMEGTITYSPSGK